MVETNLEGKTYFKCQKCGEVLLIITPSFYQDQIDKIWKEHKLKCK